MKLNTCVGLTLFVVEQSIEGVCMGISFTLLPPYIFKLNLTCLVLVHFLSCLFASLYELFGKCITSE